MIKLSGLTTDWDGHGGSVEDVALVMDKAKLLLLLRTTAMTREQIILQMCYTTRHDYGIIKSFGSISSGLTEIEREFIWRQMAQLFDNVIAPNMEFKREDSYSRNESLQ